MSGQQPTTIFNFESRIDEILAAVENIQANYVTVNSLNQLPQLAVISNQITTLTAAITNLTTLWQALLAALNNVATIDLQNQEIALLQEIVGFTATTKPVRIQLDLANATHVRQPLPTAPGP